MNKKIKMIELLNKIANNEKLPKKVFFDNETFELTAENIYKSSTSLLMDCINYDGTNLNDEVEILEDNTEEIEELKMNEASLRNTVNKINELIQAINHIKKEREER